MASRPRRTTETRHSEGRSAERSIESTPGEGCELSYEQGTALLDAEARRRLGMSGDEFLRRWDAGEFTDLDSRPGLVAVWLLLPFARPEPSRD